MTGWLAWKQGQYFAPPDVSIEKLRSRPDSAPYNLVETSYFGFSIPDHASTAKYIIGYIQSYAS
jgi:hypothetical protein